MDRRGHGTDEWIADQPDGSEHHHGDRVPAVRRLGGQRRINRNVGLDLDQLDGRIAIGWERSVHVDERQHGLGVEFVWKRWHVWRRLDGRFDRGIDRGIDCRDCGRHDSWQYGWRLAQRRVLERIELHARRRHQ